MTMRRRDLQQILTVCLGGLWLLDGILQLQPAMFTSAFVQAVLLPTLQNQPRILAAVISFGIQVASISPFWFNVIAAGIQLLIGALLLSTLFHEHETLVHFALWLSVAWALIIWIFGEGLGILATGSTTFYTGAPGSALLYAILALFLLHVLPIEKLPLAAGIVFFVGAGLNLTPMFWRPTMLSMLAMVPSVSSWLGGFGAQGTMLGNLLAIDVLAALGIFLICLPRNRTVAWIAIVSLAVIWAVGQTFGGILTFPFGTATDPNSAPILALFLLPTL